MNTQGCPEGFFTDEILVYFSVPLSCDSSVAAWLGFSVSIVAVRVLILGLVWYAWYYQTFRNVRATHGNGANSENIRKKQKRFPLVPFFSTIDTLLIGLLVLLSSLDVISATKGNSVLVFVLWLTAVCFIQFATLKKMVALGLRIFRFDVSDTHHSHSAEGIRALGSFDNLLKVLVTLMIALVFLALVTSIVEAAIGGGDARLPRLVLSAMCVEQMLFYWACLYQYSRCLTFVKAMRAKTENERYATSFAAAIQKMRYQQVVMVITCLGELGFFLYFIVTLDLYFWLTCVVMILDCFIYFFMSISFLPCFLHATHKTSSKGASGSGVGGATTTHNHSSRLMRNEDSAVSSRGGGSSRFNATQQASSSRAVVAVGEPSAMNLVSSNPQQGNSSSFLMIRASSHDDIDA